MKFKNTKSARQFLLTSTAFALLNIMYLYFLTQAPTLEKNNLAISYEEVLPAN
jgi:hypothetical protein